MQDGGVTEPGKSWGHRARKQPILRTLGKTHPDLVGDVGQRPSQSVGKRLWVSNASGPFGHKTRARGKRLQQPLQLGGLLYLLQPKLFQEIPLFKASAGYRVTTATRARRSRIGP